MTIVNHHMHLLNHHLPVKSEPIIRSSGFVNIPPPPLSLSCMPVQIRLTPKDSDSSQSGNSPFQQQQDVQAAGMSSQHPQNQQQRQQQQQSTVQAPRPYATQAEYTIASAAGHPAGSVQQTWGNQTIRGAKAPGWLLYDKQVRQRKDCVSIRVKLLDCLGETPFCRTHCDRLYS